jgi:hypothetical protein
VTNVDTRAYFNWQQMKNDSTRVTFCPSNADSCGGFFENELWDYKKQNAGIDAYWRVNRGNRLGFGFDYNHITQNRPDFDDTSTNTYWVEWKNTQLDNVTARIKYSYIHRHSTSSAATPGRALTIPFTWSDSSTRSTSRTSTRTA